MASDCDPNIRNSSQVSFNVSAFEEINGWNKPCQWVIFSCTHWKWRAIPSIEIIACVIGRITGLMLDKDLLNWYSNWPDYVKPNHHRQGIMTDVVGVSER
jgi:hypothetical protein